MRIALDATYSVASQPSGIAVYSREILDGLPKLFPAEQYVRSYRWKQWRQNGFRGRLLLPPLPTFRAHVFHALNQRVDSRMAPRVVSTFHDLFVMTAEYSSPEFRQRFERQARDAAARSDLIIAVSQFTASQVEELLKVPAARIRVIPHGARPPQRPRPQADPPFILCVGAIQARKNTSNLVRAFAAVPEPWRLVLAGSCGGYGSDEIIALVRDNPRIEITGYVSPQRLEELYCSAAVFAFPSLDEGFGMPVIEAMAAGIPVLTSDRSAMREVAEGAALLVDPLNVDDIAHGLCALAEDRVLRARLIEAGLERSRRFTWDVAVQRTHAVYRELSS